MIASLPDLVTVILLHSHSCLKMFQCILDDHCQDDLSDILSELKVLIHVGEHENVLRILGACTKGKIY